MNKVLNCTLGMIIVVLWVMVLAGPSIVIYNHYHNKSIEVTRVKQKITVKQEITVSQVTAIYNKLRLFTGIPDDIPSLLIVDDSDPNAWMSHDNLSVTTGLLKYVKNEDELAAIMGHEMGHMTMGHLEGTLQDDSRIHEANADKFGVYLMLRAGYDPCKIADFWVRFNRDFGDTDVTTSHPAPIQRAYELDFPMCHRSPV